MKKLYYVCIIALIALFAGIIYMHSLQYFEYRGEADVLAIELDKEKETLGRLEREKEQYMSDAYIEKIAREKLGLVRHDEIVFINDAVKQ